MVSQLRVGGGMRFPLLLVLIGIPSILPSQLVRGRVVDSEGGSLSHALVELQSTTGQFSTKVVTTGTGLFALTVPAPGSYTVRLAAIGFSPKLTEPFEVSDFGYRLGQVALERAVISLAEIEVAVTDRCGSREGSGTTLARLLDAAQSSLDVMESAISGGSGYRIEQISRTMMGVSRPTVISADTSIRTMAAWPIISIGSDSLSKVGFSRLPPLSDGGGRMWYGPDVAVLFDQWFLESHCFTVASDGAEMIAVTFEPDGTNKDNVEIAGTLLLDRGSLALSRLTFEHRQLPDRLVAGVAGGMIDFSRMPDGLWVPVVWRIFAPIQDARARAVGTVEVEGRLVGVVDSGPTIRP